MPTINLGLQKINKEEEEYIISAMCYLDNPAFLGHNFINNINFFIKQITINKETLENLFPPEHLIAYLWLLKEVAEA